MKTTLNVITYEPLIDNGEGRLPRQRPLSTHSEFRPTVKMCQGEKPDRDLGYDDLAELFGYDEERGLTSELVLDKGTLIEIPLIDEYEAVTWVDGTVTSITEGSLKFKVVFQGCEIDSGNWSQTRSRADMESTWRFPPDSRRRQPGVHAILATKGYTPWHHPQHGSHWLRLQPRGTWKYKTHDAQGIQQTNLFGWRMGLSMMNMDVFHSGGHDFNLRSFVEDHMSREDLGQGTSTQDWADIQTLGRELLRWEDIEDNPQARNRWSYMPDGPTCLPGS